MSVFVFLGVWNPMIPLRFAADPPLSMVSAADRTGAQVVAIFWCTFGQEGPGAWYEKTIRMFSAGLQRLQWKISLEDKLPLCWRGLWVKTFQIIANEGGYNRYILTLATQNGPHAQPQRGQLAE